MNFTKLRALVVLFGTGIIMLAVVGFAFMLYPWTLQFLAHRPEVTYMKWPVLLLAWATLVPVLCGLLLATGVLWKIIRGTYFVQATPRLLKLTGNMFLLDFLLGCVFTAYLNISQPHGLLTQLASYMIMAGAFLVLLVGFVFHLYARMADQANAYKEETDLTV